MDFNETLLTCFRVQNLFQFRQWAKSLKSIENGIILNFKYLKNFVLNRLVSIENQWHNESM